MLQDYFLDEDIHMMSSEEKAYYREVIQGSSPRSTGRSNKGSRRVANQQWTDRDQGSLRGKRASDYWSGSIPKYGLRSSFKK